VQAIKMQTQCFLVSVCPRQAVVIVHYSAVLALFKRLMDVNKRRGLQCPVFSKALRIKRVRQVVLGYSLHLPPTIIQQYLHCEILDGFKDSNIFLLLQILLSLITM
jgi:hypothetical protein